MCEITKKEQKTVNPLTMKYSVIVPVFNRPKEVEELLESLAQQTYKDFEVVIIEDGSTETCEEVGRRYEKDLTIRYHYKQNSGPGDSRNVGMEKGTGEYLIFFDSDCIIPPHYFENVENYLAHDELDTFGGPDNAKSTFSDVQKAINYAMTSFITTGGVRGKKSKLDQFQPRSFNMGIKKEVYKKVGGFSDIHPGEDPELSYRIMNAGFKVGLIEDAYVYHKRRIDFSKFIKQVYKFGVVRIILMKWFPDKFKLTYTFPSIFLLGSIGLVLLSLVVSVYFLAPLLLLVLILFLDALARTKNLKVTLLAVLASFIQLYSYGWGFLKSAYRVMLLKKPEREAFVNFFFKNRK